MRKIDDDKLLKMLKEGKKQYEIAEHFRVSPAAICKRLKRLLPPPESLQKLTDRQKRFCAEVAGGKTQTQAVMASYEVSTMDSAKVIGSQLMSKPEIQGAVKDLMDYHGLSKGYRVRRLKDHVDNRDPNVSLKALDQSWKLSGDYSPEKHMTMNIDYQILNKEHEQIQEALDELVTEHPELRDLLDD